MTEGICRICGYYKKLSFEHIPPKSAFNDQPRVLETIESLLAGYSHTKFRKGIGRNSLCEQCNSTTGGWYGGSFSDWSRQGLEWFGKLDDKSLFSLPYYVKPLNVIKQIVVMSLAMASEQTLKFHQELRSFVLNKHQRYLPPNYQVYTYFNIDGRPRFASGMVIMRTDINCGDFVEAEVALPPFGYCISTPVRGTRSLAETEGLCEITWFSNYGYDEFVPIYLQLPAKETHEPFPLDYRSKSDIAEHYKLNDIPERS